MPKKYIPAILSIVAVFVIILLEVLSVKTARASLTSCTINSTSPNSVTSGGSATLTFNITNSDEGGNLVHWVKITRPSDSFTITSGDGPSSGGSTIGDGGSSVAIRTTLSSGETGDFSVGITTTGGVTSSGSFTVEASDSSEGDAPITCSGDTTVSLTSGGSEAISISGVSLSVSSTSSTISWTTSIPTTGAIQYGTTSGYGSSANDSTSGTSHSVTISGLSASTTYHYKITAIDLSNNSTETGDNTFVTGAAGTATTVTTTVTNTVTVAKVFTDTTPPSVRFTTEFKKLYEEAPLVGITASDGTGIARIEYSTNGGKDWSPLDLTDNFGDKKIITDFTPNISEDGDYSLVVKVTDTTGNKILSKEVKFTIDRLPPRVGPLVVMAGPLIISKGNTDNTELLAGVEYRFILSSAGGPNAINMVCGDTKYEFNKNEDIGVWSTKVKFDVSGECVPTVTAVDGAGNIQEINEGKLVINELGKLTNGTITVYWYDDFEKKFVVWDGEPYGQVNPINTNNLGGYGVLLPAGKYYLEAKSSGKRTTVSNIIDISETAYINDSWDLSPVWKFWQLRDQKIIRPKTLGSNTWKPVSIDLPKVILNKAGMSTLDIRGKVSVVSLLPSWHPLTNEYLKNMDELYKNKINVYPILLQEKESTAVSVKRRGGYEVSLYSDKDGDLLKDTEVSGLPTTWIVNRFGKVVKVKVGIVSSEEILDELSKVE